MNREQEAKDHGMRWIECEECHGLGSVFSPDGSGQHWCMGCHGEGGEAFPEIPDYNGSEDGVARL